MCFHTKQTKTPKQIEKRFNAKFDTGSMFEPTMHFNGFNHPKTPIITTTSPEKIQMFHWGLVPGWAAADWNQNATLNARIETLTEKPTFKNYLTNRCIVLVDGFYEWQHQGKNKIKFEIGFNNQLFAFAGLFCNNTYTIITTQAQGIMREIHNTKLRMPFSLKTDADFENWLRGADVMPKYDFNANPLDFLQPRLF